MFSDLIISGARSGGCCPARHRRLLRRRQPPARGRGYTARQAVGRSATARRRGHHAAGQLQGAGGVLARVVYGQGGARGPRREGGAMTAHFRNVDFDCTAPLDRWPAEAIETLLDRGSLSDWRRLADAIRHNPWGPAAHGRDRGRMGRALRRRRADGRRDSTRSRGPRPTRTVRVRRANTLLARPDRADAPPVRPRGRHLGVPALRLREREGRPHHRRTRPPQPRRRDTHTEPVARARVRATVVDHSSAS